MISSWEPGWGPGVLVGKDSAVAGVAVLYAEVTEGSKGPTGRAQDSLCGSHQAHGLWESSPAVLLSPGDSSPCEERCLHSSHLEMTNSCLPSIAQIPCETTEFNSICRADSLRSTAETNTTW